MFYRCYKIGHDGSTLGLQNFRATNDDEAWLVAGRYQSDLGWHAFELWEGLRQLHRPIEAPDAAA